MKLNFENPVFRALGLVADLVWLNILTALLVIPVVTAGASLAAMHAALIRICRGEDGYITKTFFHDFRANLKPAVPLTLLLALIGAVLFADYGAAEAVGGTAGDAMRMITFLVAAAVLLFTRFLFPLVARFEEGFRGYIRNSASLAIAYFPRALGMAALDIGAAAAFFLYGEHLFPLYIMLGLTGPGYLKARLYDPVLRKIEAQD